jgi:histidyl-tRNA synthetase
MNQKCKGARDLLPEDTEQFRYIEDIFRNSCASWGYQEVKTPTLEYLHLFTSAGTLTPSMLNKVYSFLDWDGWSGERVVLRPDGTIPVARLYNENFHMQEYSRLFYFTNVFAFEETGKENREKWQCGIEFFGNPEPTADIEAIALGIEMLRNLYIEDIEIRLSHAGILKALINDLGLSPEKQRIVLNEIHDGNWEIFSTIKAMNQKLGNLLELLLKMKSKSGALLGNIKALGNLSPELNAALDKFIQITQYLDALGCRYLVDITSTRGFEYYTGICFNFFLKGERIGGGGRYDDLLPLMGGRQTPACGFALYIDSLMKMVKGKVGQNRGHGVFVHGACSKQSVVKSCFKLSESLRSIGYIAELGFNEVQTKWRWIVNVDQKKSAFTITDQLNSTVNKVSSIEAVIDMIGGL